MARLAGKVAFIGGATMGIGKVTAEIFAREGAKVVLTGRSADAGEAAADEIRKSGGDAMFIRTDVTDSDSVQAAIAKTISKYGRLHILFNNAGGSSNKDGSVVNGSLDEFWRVIKLDLFGTFLTCRFAVPEIIKAGGGAVINNASMAGVTGTYNRDGYCSAKGAVINLTRSMALEFVNDKVRVNAIAPAMVGTERILGFLKDSPDAKRAIEKQPLGLIDPVEIGYTAVFLASDEARSITGQTIQITGGS